MPRKPSGRPPGRPRKPAENPDGPQAVSPGAEYQGLPLLFWESEDPTQTRVRMMREAANKKWEFHGYLSTDEAGPERVAEMFGGGRYLVQLVTAQAEGPSRIKETKLIVIPGAYRPPVGPLPGMQAATYPEARPAPARGPGPGAAEVDAWTLATQRMQAGLLTPREALDQATVAQLLELTKTTRGNAPNWGELLVQLVPLVLERVMTPRGGDEVSAKLDRLIAVMEAQRQQGPVASSFADLTQAIEQVMGIRERLAEAGSGKSDDEEGGGMLKMAMELVKTLAAAGQAQGAAAPAGSRIPGKVEVPVAPSPDTTPGPGVPLWKQLLGHYRAQLLDAARRGLSPSLVSDIILNYLPSEYAGVLQEFLARPDADQVVIQEIPELAEFQSWNRKLWTDLRGAVSDQADEGEDTE